MQKLTISGSGTLVNLQSQTKSQVTPWPATPQSKIGGEETRIDINNDNRNDMTMDDTDGDDESDGNTEDMYRNDINITTSPSPGSDNTNYVQPAKFTSQEGESILM